jgi:hypothetical protein
MHNDILKLAYEVSSITEKKVVSIDTVVRQARFLAINTRIEAARAGAGGTAFSVFADEMRDVATTITAISAELRAAISESTARLAETGSRLVIATKGARFADLALNVIDIIDRNLYERSCDVRWWATDSAVVAALEAGDEESLRHATGRLRIILNSYTVYLDLCIVDRSGVVVACGRPDLYPRAVGQNFSQASWFRDAMQTRSGDEYAAGGVQHVPALNGAAAATYATAIRQGGHLNGRILGVLGILFDWTPQSSAVVTGVRLTPEEQSSTRVMIVDAHYHILAASDGAQTLSDTYPLEPTGSAGFYVKGNCLVAYALTPGYETYKGLGWYGVIEVRLNSQPRV